MEFLKVGDFWTYQIPEWDNYEKDILEKILFKLDFISVSGLYHGSRGRCMEDRISGSHFQTGQ